MEKQCKQSFKKEKDNRTDDVVGCGACCAEVVELYLSHLQWWKSCATACGTEIETRRDTFS